jgi:phage/plasmid-like protein (TIGR03299 family)
MAGPPYPLGVAVSTQSSEWLNTKTLIGFADERGHAWHYRAEHQGDEPNHYPREIPAADVTRRLFDWQALSSPVVAVLPRPSDIAPSRHNTGYDPDGRAVHLAWDYRHQAIVHSGTGRVLGVFSGRYQIHQYQQWLLEATSTLIADTLRISSAGLLDGGGKAWVQIEAPETMHTPEGVDFRPHILAVTSHDGSLPTRYSHAITNVVCDNTMRAGLDEHNGAIWRTKHTSGSSLKIDSAREALSIVERTADSFTEEVAKLCSITVSNPQFNRVLDAVVPLPKKPGRGLTMAERRRVSLIDMYQDDPRVKPWAGTAWGVVQLLNTWSHHEAPAHGQTKVARNLDRMVVGGWDKVDGRTLDMLAKVLPRKAGLLPAKV